MTSKMEFQFPTEEEKALVRKSLGTNERDIQQAVTTLRSWLQTQPHLPNVMDDGRLERMYICCKCSIERTKKSLDAYYTLKTRFPDMLMNRDPLKNDVTDILQHVTLCTVPRLNKDGHRIGCLTDLSPDSSKFDYFKIAKYSIMAIELILSFDYSVGYIFIIDLKNLTVGHITKIGVRDVSAGETILRRAYSKRLVAIHLVNAPKVVDMLLSIISPAIPQKLQKRIYTHLPGSQTLFDHVSKDFVPVEMGGTAGVAKDMMDAVLRQLVARRQWFLDEDRHVVDEKKRPQDNAYQYDLFGVDGSFKKLQVD